MTVHEFALIDRYFKSIANRTADAVQLGPGDDCAILRPPTGTELCVSTDTLVEGVHFPEKSPAKLVAERTMAANLSDLAGMGADPLSFVLAITLPEVNEPWLEELSLALSDLIGRYDIPLVGGNLSKGNLSLTMTVMGTVPEGEGVLRSGAREGDDIYVTGTIGDAAAGLEKTRKGENEDYLAGRYASPTPRLEAGRALRGIASAMIDISDGLMSETGHICTASHTGAVLMVDELPLSKELLDFAGVESAVRMALFAGDDYELCFTAAAAQKNRIAAIGRDLDLPMTRVGQVTGGSEVIAMDGKKSGSGIQRCGISALLAALMNNPSTAKVFTDPRYLLAYGLGSGLAPKAPGTAGSLAGLLLFVPVMLMPTWFQLLVIVVAVMLGVAVVEAVAEEMESADPGGIVWDEFVGMWITLLFLPGWLWVIPAFLLFRLFDIWKPWPVSLADQQMHGGLGIMADDIVAAVYALGTLQLFHFAQQFLTNG